MPRLTLRQFQMPDYASQVPDIPRSERPIQKLADLLYILHNVPWFKKKDDRESGMYDSKSGVTGDEAGKAVTDSLVNDRPMEDIANEKARKPDFGLDQAMPIELQLMGLRKPFGVENSTDEDEKKEEEKDEFEKAMDEAERKRGILEQDPFMMSANKDKEGLKEMQETAGLTGKDVDSKWGPQSERARQRALHPEDLDEKLWADTEMERYVNNAIRRELWGD